MKALDQAVDSFLSKQSDVPERSLGISADDAAKRYALARDNGLSESVAFRNSNEIQKRALESSADLSSYIRNYPAFEKHLASPLKREAIRDDMENLSYFARWTGDFKQSLSTGFAVADMGDIGTGLILEDFGIKDLTPDERNRLNKFRTRETKDYGIGFFAGIPGATAEMLPPVVKAGVASAVVGGITGAASAAGTLLTGPFAPATATPAFTGGFVAGFGPAMTTALAYQELGPAYIEYRDFTDDSGQRIEKEVALGAALATAAVNGLLEKYGLDKALEMFPGADRLLGKFQKEGIGELLKDRKIRSAFANVGARIGHAGIAEGGTEFLQEGVNILFGEIAKAASSGDFGVFGKQSDIQSRVEGFLDSVSMLEGREQETQTARVAAFLESSLLRSLEAGVRGAQGGIGFASAGAATSIAADRWASHRQHIVEQKGLASLKEAAQKSKTLKRDKVLFEEITRDLAEQSLYVNAKDFQEFFQSHPDIEIGPILQDIPEIQEQIEEALSLGGDIVIPAASVAKVVGTTDLYDGIMPYMRLSPDALTENDFLSDYATTIFPSLEKEREAFAREDEYTDFTLRLRDGLMNSGYTPESARIMSSVAGSSYRAMSESYGIESPSAKRWLENVIGKNLSVEPSVWKQAAPAETYKADALDAMIENARKESEKPARKTPKKKQTPLLGYIRKIGGIRHDSDLAQALMGRDIKGKSARGIFRETGGSLDNIPISEIAALPGYESLATDKTTDGGYADIDFLVSAIENEALGEGSTEPLSREEAFLEYLNQNDIDISLSNKEIKDRLEALKNNDGFADTPEEAAEIESKIAEIEAQEANMPSVDSATEESVPEEDQTTEGVREKPLVDAKESDPLNKIEDFGEKLEGARKDAFKDYKSKIMLDLPEKESEITISEHLPKPDYDGLIAQGADPMVLAAIGALRDSLPPKPRKSYKLKNWVSALKSFRELSASLVNGDVKYNEISDKLRLMDIRINKDIEAKIILYSALGYPSFLKAKEFDLSSPTKGYGSQKWSVYKNKRYQESFDSSYDAVESIRKRLNVEPSQTQRQTTLDVLINKRTKEVFIAKKVGALSSGKYIRLKGGFKSSIEARAYIKENEKALLVLLERKKNIPSERRPENDPRVGEDYRRGDNVSPEKFAAEFGFRGVQFGNWVEQDRRLDDLNNAYDALLDMSGILGIPARAVSLNGTLGLAFGSRGRGGKNPAKAHYEPDHVVINLTKKAGPGSLAHEWWHGLDNYFGKKQNKTYLTERPAFLPEYGVREEVANAFYRVMHSISKTGVYKRSHELDKMRSKDYWSTRIEMSARSFEAYIVYKANQKGEVNDYLANIVGQDAWGALVEEEDSSYPYPTKQEMQEHIAPAFDALFDLLETRETEQGVELFQQKSGVDFEKFSPKTDDIKGIVPDPKIYEGASSVPVDSEAYRALSGIRGWKSSGWIKEDGSLSNAGKKNLVQALEAHNDKLSGKSVASQEKKFLRKAKEENESFLSEIHKNKNLSFKSLALDDLKNANTIVLHKSAKYAGRQGSEYYLGLVGGELAYIRKSNHWGKFSTNIKDVETAVRELGISRQESKDLQAEDPFRRIGQSEHVWDLEGAERKKDGAYKNTSQAGYILLRDIPVGQELFQQDASDAPRGSATFFSEKIVVKLFESKDLSTFLHEWAHVMSKAMQEIAALEDAPQSAKRDLEALRKFVGAKAGKDMTVAQEEKFAVAFEEYLATGVAPSTGLQAAFRRIKLWMRSLYGLIAGKRVKLSSEVKDLFDRLLATEEEILSLRNMQTFSPDDSIMEILTAAEKKAYLRDAEKAEKAAEEDLLSKFLKQKKREDRKWWKEERASVEEEVRKRVYQTPVYKAISWLRKGTFPDGSAPVPEKSKLNKVSVRSMIGQEGLSRLPDGVTKAGKDSVHPDIIAPALGFRTGSDLLSAMQNAPDMKAEIQRITDEEMKSRYGDIMTDGTAEREALLSAHNASKAEMIARELKALERKTGVLYPENADFKSAAQKYLSQKTIKDGLSPDRYYRAEVRAARDAGKALAKKDYQAAAEAKRRQLLNHHLYREARDSKGAVDKALRRLTRLSRPQKKGSVRIDADYHKKIIDILDAYDIGPRLSDAKKERLNMAALADWVERKQKDDAAKLIVPQEIVDAERKTHYRDLTLDEFFALLDLVENIAHQGREKRILFLRGEKMDLDEKAQSLAENIRKNVREKKTPIQTDTKKERTKRTSAELLYSIVKARTIVKELDGFEDLGPLHDAVFGSIDEAEARRADRMIKVSKDLHDIFKRRFGKNEYGLASKRTETYIPEIGETLQKDGLLALALNWGNIGNREKLAAGYAQKGLNIDTMPVLFERYLDANDWAFVQEVWDYIDQFWPEIEALEKRRTGVSPEKVEASSFEVRTSDGQTVVMRGGYYPIHYDRHQDYDSFQKDLENAMEIAKSGGYARAQTKRGHTIERVEGVRKPILLSLSPLFSHVQQVVTDIEMGSAIENTYKILSHRDVRSAITGTLGNEAYQQLDLWLKDVAVGHIVAPGMWNNIAQQARAGVSISAMAFKVGTVLAQPSGITQTVSRIGLKDTLRGLFAALGNGNVMEINKNAMFAFERSAILKNRSQTFHRDAYDLYKNLHARGGIERFSVQYGFWPVAKMQMLIDLPTWLGGYKQGLDKFGGDEKRAAEYADVVLVESQSSGLIKDLSSFERGTLDAQTRLSPVVRLMGVFYSYFNAKFNLAYMKTKATDFKKPSDVARLASDFFLLFFVEAMITEALLGRVPDFGDDEEESFLFWMLRMGVANMAATVPVVREVAGSIQGFDGYPAGFRPIKEIGQAAGTIVSETMDAFDDDESFEIDKILIQLNDAGGIIFKYPSSSLGQVARTMRDADTEEKSLWDYLVYRK